MTWHALNPPSRIAARATIEQVRAEASKVRREIDGWKVRPCPGDTVRLRARTVADLERKVRHLEEAEAIMLKRG